MAIGELAVGYKKKEGRERGGDILENTEIAKLFASIRLNATI